MKMEISRNEVAQRVIHDLAGIVEQLRIEMQQHIAALDLKRFGNICRGADRADIGTRGGQSIAARNQKVQHRAMEVRGQDFRMQEIFRKYIHKICNRPGMRTNYTSLICQLSSK